MKVNPKLLAFAPVVVLVVYGCVTGELGGDAVQQTPTTVVDGGEPCSDDPFKCKAGLTCWPDGDGGATCVASKAYKTKGTDCEMLAGRSSCADGLVCITVDKPLDAGMDTGKTDVLMPTSVPISLCAPWCDDKHPCPPGETCRILSLEGFAARACVPPNLEPPDTGPPDTGMPDTFKPDTFKPDTGTPETSMDTAVMDTVMMETAMDTAMPDTTMPDTTPPADTAPETSVSDSADAD
jgi:hypothetical protein